IEDLGRVGLTNEWTRSTALITLANLDQSEVVFRRLKAAAQYRDSGLWSVYRRVSPKFPIAIQKLLPDRQVDRNRIRADALSILGFYGTNALSVLPLFDEQLKDKSYQYRLGAVMALSNLERQINQLDPHHPGILQIYHRWNQAACDIDMNVRLAALAEITRCATETANAAEETALLDGLAITLQDSSQIVRDKAVDAVRKASLEKAALVKMLRTTAMKQSGGIRLSILSALWGREQDAKFLLPLLEQMAKDPDPWIRANADDMLTTLKERQRPPKGLATMAEEVPR
ncbi:MAG: hypothetical protein JWM16_3982, partial [Verrucomicrobiales bacterium]|nr:hypothetical protein [Verrucomicrobiales bacterium]